MSDGLTGTAGADTAKREAASRLPSMERVGQLVVRSRYVFRSSSLTLAFLATVQAVLGSFSFFRSTDPVDYQTVHMAIGVAMAILAILLLGFVAPARFRHRRATLWLCVGLFAATAGQFILGMASNDDVGLLAYHIPAGVLLLVLSYVVVAVSFGLRLESHQA